MLSYSLIKHLSTIPVTSTTDREMVIFVYIIYVMMLVNIAVVIGYIVRLVLMLRMYTITGC